VTSMAADPEPRVTRQEPVSRVLVVTHGGMRLDRRIVSQANALAATGRAVTLAASPFDRETSGLDDRITVVTGPKPEGGVDRRLNLSGRLPSPIHAGARWLWYRLRGGPAEGVRRYMSGLPLRGPFDIIHAHDLPSLPAAAELRRALGAQRLIYDAHELYPFQTRSPIQCRYWQRIERSLVGEADLVVAVNPSAAGQLSRIYGVDEPTVLYNACEPGQEAAEDPRAAFASLLGLEPGDNLDVRLRERRNNVVDVLLFISDFNCETYLSRAFANRAFINVSNNVLQDVASGVTSGAATVSPQASAAIGLSALVIGSATDEISSAFYLNQTFQAMETVIRTERKLQRQDIESKLETLPYEQYSLHDALSDVRLYSETCSIRAGLQLLAKAAEQDRRHRLGE